MPHRDLLRAIARGAACLFLLHASPGRAVPEPARPAALRYAALPFVFSPAHRDLQWLTEAFALSVSDRLERLGLTVATRRDRAEVAESAGVASPSPVTLASRIKLARALRSDRAITGTLAFEPGEGKERAAGQIIVTATILDVKRGRVLHRRTLGGTMNELFSMMDEIALEVAWQDLFPPGPEARVTLRQIQDPPLPAYEVVMKAIVEKDPERQTVALEAAARAAKDHAMLSRWVADSLVETGRVEEGMAKLRSLDPASQPDPWRLHLDIAEIHIARGETEEASTAAARSVAARDSAPAHMLLARIALARGDLSLAALEARLASALDPEHPALPALLQQIAGGPEPQGSIPQ